MIFRIKPPEFELLRVFFALFFYFIMPVRASVREYKRCTRYAEIKSYYVSCGVNVFVSICRRGIRSNWRVVKIREKKSLGCLCFWNIKQ